MFNFFKGKEKGNVLYAPCKGKVVPLTEVPDPTFSEKLLGDGFAVIPTEGKVYAPADAEVTMVFDTLHAIGITASNGAEILIHIGMDTVKLNGQGFKSHIKIGDTITKGQLLMEFDIDFIKGKGLEVTTPVVISNSENFTQMEEMLGTKKHGDQMIIL